MNKSFFIFTAFATLNLLISACRTCEKPPQPYPCKVIKGREGVFLENLNSGQRFYVCNTEKLSAYAHDTQVNATFQSGDCDHPKQSGIASMDYQNAVEILHVD